MSSEKSYPLAQEKPTVDYNAKARVILLVTEEEKNKDFDLKVLLWEGPKLGPRDDEDKTKEVFDAFLEKNKAELHHGDILTTSDTDRASGAFIVHYNETLKKFTALKNKDESGSGYLTIPAEVLEKVTNAMEKYADVFTNDETSFLNMHISLKDDFIKEKLGEEVISFNYHKPLADPRGCNQRAPPKGASSFALT